MKKAIAKKEVKKSPIDKLLAQKRAAGALFQSSGFGGQVKNSGNRSSNAKQTRGSRGDR
jgi:hypothetical protein